MPWYDWDCEKCGTVKDVPAGIKEMKKTCKECGSLMRRMISSPALRFRGSGWTVRKPVETFSNEPEYTDDWGSESHGMGSDPGNREE